MKKLVLLLLTTLFLFTYSCGGEDSLSKSEFKEKSLKVCESNAKTPEKKAECKDDVNKIDNCKDYDGEAAYKVTEGFDKMEKCIKAAGDDQNEKLKCFTFAMAIQTDLKKVCSNYEEVFQSDPK